MSHDSYSLSNEPAPASCHAQPASDSERRPPEWPRSLGSEPSSSIDALLASVNRLCGLLEIHNLKIAQLIDILVTVEPVEPEADPDAPPTHDLAGRRIEVR